MKTYEKPKLIALSLSGNNMLCNTCAVDIIAPTEDQALVDILEDFHGPIDKLFATAEADCAKHIEYEGYCKFTGANVVINS